MLKINRRLSIPESEITFRFSTSSKPGGQNVDRVNTKVTLLFDVAASRALSERQKARITKKLKGRINREGILRVSSQKHRSQSENRKAVLERLVSLLQNALKRSARRKKTRKPRAVKERRLKAKKRRGRLKKLRSSVDPSREK
ncbi:MAG TPA: alternative ribosome rescue aminoacyl-tRNA hydrolase ArfB [Candidatus Krumholzibacteriaceae bacterium]|nr:alternative ribosome rescue aminoacyl-tRNA hydrolase ArfB [Candidatus Krumholzibacteriaceae bacterium]